jgi:hypothetical protein
VNILFEWFIFRKINFRQVLARSCSLTKFERKGSDHTIPFSSRNSPKSSSKSASCRLLRPKHRKLGPRRDLRDIRRIHLPTVRTAWARRASEYNGSLLDELYQQHVKQIGGYRFQDGDRLNQVIAHVQAAKDDQEKVNLQREVMREYEEMKEHFERDLQPFDAETAGKIQQPSMNQGTFQSAREQKQEDGHSENDRKLGEAQKRRQYDRASGQ